MYASWIFMKSNHSGNFWDFWASLHYFPERPRPVQAHTPPCTLCEEISFVQREDIEQLLAEKFASEGIQDQLFCSQTCHHPTFQSPLLTARDQIWFSNLAQSGAELWPPEVARCHWPMVQADWTYGRFVVKWLLQRMAGLRPGEAPDVPTPDLFPLTLYYRWGWRLYDCIKELRSYCRIEARVWIRFNFSVHTSEQVLNLR